MAESTMEPVAGVYNAHPPSPNPILDWKSSDLAARRLAVIKLYFKVIFFNYKQKFYTIGISKSKGEQGR